METFKSDGIGGDGFRQKLDGDNATKRYVFGLVHNTHPAFAQALKDSIVGDDLTDHVSRPLYLDRGGALLQEEYSGCCPAQIRNSIRLLRVGWQALITQGTRGVTAETLT